MMLDLFLIIFIGFSAIVGYKKGLVLMLFNLLGTFVAGAIAYFFHGQFKTIIINQFHLDEKIFTKISEKLASAGESSVLSKNVAGQGYDISNLPLPKNVKESIDSFVADKSAEAVESTAHVLTDFIMNLVGFVGLFVLAIIVIKIIGFLLDHFAKLPIINKFNQLGGMLFSVLAMLVIISVAFVLMMTFVPVNDFNFLESQIKSSMAAKYFIEYNPFMYFLAK